MAVNHNPGRVALTTNASAENLRPTADWMSGGAVVATDYRTRKNVSHYLRKQTGLPLLRGILAMENFQCLQFPTLSLQNQERQGRASFHFHRLAFRTPRCIIPIDPKSVPTA